MGSLGGRELSKRLEKEGKMSTAFILFFACFAPLFVCLPLLWLFDRYAFDAYHANV